MLRVEWAETIGLCPNCEFMTFWLYISRKWSQFFFQMKLFGGKTAVWGQLPPVPLPDYITDGSTDVTIEWLHARACHFNPFANIGLTLRRRRRRTQRTMSRQHQYHDRLYRYTGWVENSIEQFTDTVHESWSNPMASRKDQRLEHSTTALVDSRGYLGSRI